MKQESRDFSRGRFKTRLQLAADRELVEDRAFGALIGLAMGDSLGDAARTAENHQRYGVTTDFGSGASWSTDDTEFALLTAEILIKSGGNPTIDDVVRSWREHVLIEDELNRGGASEIEAAHNIRRGLLPPLSGEYNSHCVSDGAAMRAAPIGIIAAGDGIMAASLAAVDACISHARDGVWGAQAVAVGVSQAMVGAAVPDVVSAARAAIPEQSWFSYTFDKAIEIVENASCPEEVWAPLHDELWTTYKAAVPEAISQAFAIYLLTRGDFKRGVLYAANFGRDADTIGAVVGALCGAACGASAIPDRWIEKVRYPSGTCLGFTKGVDIKTVAHTLAELVVQQGSDNPGWTSSQPGQPGRPSP